MEMILPRQLENDVYRFLKIVVKKGSAPDSPDINKLIKAVQRNSSAVDRYVARMIDTQLLEAAATGMLTQAEIALIDKITVALQKWRGPRMRDQKIYHTGISCVLSSVEIIDMEIIRGVTDENDSEILRRLIRGAAAKVRRNR